MPLTAEQKSLFLAGPGVMLLSAGIFGFFGFYFIKPTAPDGQFVLFMAILMWTLKVSSVLFLLCALLGMFAPRPANLLYAVAGVVGAGLFVVVAIMDYADKRYQAALHPVLLLVFAAWNGCCSWTSLRALLMLRHAKGPVPPGPGG